MTGNTLHNAIAASSDKSLGGKVSRAPGVSMAPHNGLSAVFPAISARNTVSAIAGVLINETPLFDAIKNNRNIDVAGNIKDKTKVEILDISPSPRSGAEFWP